MRLFFLAILFFTTAFCPANLRNRVSYTEVWDYGFEQYASAATYYSYDIHGNVDNLLQDYGNSAGKPNVMNTVNGTPSGNRFKKLSYSYDLISGKVNMVAYQPPLQDQANPNISYPNADAFYHRYNYDAENRLTSVETSRDNILWTRDAKYSYYRHGPLARTELGDLHVQGVDYAYTVQGWIKGINSTSVNDGGFDMGGDGKAGSIFARDAFGISLNYFAGDYIPVNSTVAPFSANAHNMVNTDGHVVAAPLFNGNIASMTVNVPKLGNALTYGYQYDQLNRLVSMDAFGGLDNATNSFTPISIGDYRERLTYDPNGNLQIGLRNGNSGQLSLENFAYHYDAAKQNRLLSINNGVGNTTYNYTYDEIGNTTRDELESNASISWTLYKKMSQVTKLDGTTINYTYGTDNKRISKTVNGTTTWYVRDASGDIMAEYQSGNSSLNAGRLTQASVNIYGSKMLGSLQQPIDVQSAWNAAAARTFTRNQKGFYLSNHLGNNLAFVSDCPMQVSIDNNTVDHYMPTVLGATDYSPFGMNLLGRQFNATAIAYGFNGKMDDVESGYQDYGWRDYSAARRGFDTPDPLTGKYPELTPYQFASNTPVAAIDIDGLEGGLGQPFGSIYASNKDLYDDLVAGKNTPRVQSSQKAGKVIAIALAVAADAYFTKGKLTQLYLMSQVFGAFHDNPATSAAVRAQQDKESKEALVDAGIGLATGYIIGKGFGLLEDAIVIKNPSKNMLEIEQISTPVQQAQANAGGTKVQFQGAGGMFGGNQWLNKGIHADIDGIGQNVEIGFKLNAEGNDIDVSIVNYKGKLSTTETQKILKLGQKFLDEKGNLQKLKGWFEAAKQNGNVPVTDHTIIDKTIEVINKKIK